MYWVIWIIINHSRGKSTHSHRRKERLQQIHKNIQAKERYWTLLMVVYRLMYIYFQLILTLVVSEKNWGGGIYCHDVILRRWKSIEEKTSAPKSILHPFDTWQLRDSTHMWTYVTERNSESKRELQNTLNHVNRNSYTYAYTLGDALTHTNTHTHTHTRTHAVHSRTWIPEEIDQNAVKVRHMI